MKEKTFKSMIQMQNGECFYCSETLIPPFPGQKSLLPNNPTKDHIITQSEMRRYKKMMAIPKESSGLNHNIVIACYKCNCERGNKPFFMFYFHKKAIDKSLSA